MTLRILFAEPDDVLGEIYARFFDCHGFDVLAVSGGFDCMRKIALFDPQVLVLDDDLKWGGAAAVLTRLREDPLTPCPPVILVTGDAKPQQLSDSLHLPAERCFTKPLSLNHLLVAIQSAVASLPLAAQTVSHRT